MLAAHRELQERLLEGVDLGCEREGESTARPRAALRTALCALRGRCGSTRFLTLDVLAAGPAGTERRDALVEALYRRLRPADIDGEAPEVDAGWLAVANMLTLIGRLAAADEAFCLPALEDELAEAMSL